MSSDMRSESTAERSGSSIAPLAFDVEHRIAAIDQVKLRAYRLSRVRQELRRLDYMGAVLSDPVNIHYTTGTRNMPLWTSHAPGRYAFIATDGPVVLFEFAACRHLFRDVETLDEVRTGISPFYFFAGSRAAEKSGQWAKQIADLVRQYGRTNRRLAVDRCDPWVAALLEKQGIALFDAQEPLEQARKIKSPEEIACLRIAMHVCEVGVARMRDMLRPGLTENQVWATLHETNIAHGGDYIECRLLASGPRTNPWFHEAGTRVLQAGDLVTFDTDLIGPTGYVADISRAFVCPGRKATDRQRTLYALAQEQVLHNLALIKPGVEFREYAERSWTIPDKFSANRYLVLAHGVGLADEYPAVLCDGDQQRNGYEGIFEENMMISVESYLGEEGGKEGIKLEQQVLIGRTGAVSFSDTPLQNALELE